MSIRPAAGCKYFLTIRPALSVLHSSGGLAARVGAQAGFATSRTLGCAQAGFATSRTLGRLCYVLDVRVRVWYRFKYVMHLSLSSPRYPRSGSGGDEWGFAIVGLQIPHPWGQLYVANPHHCQYGQVFLYV